MQDTFQLPGEKYVIPALSIFLNFQYILYQSISVGILVLVFFSKNFSYVSVTCQTHYRIKGFHQDCTQGGRSPKQCFLF